MFGTPGIQLDLLAPAHMATLLHYLYEFSSLPLETFHITDI